MRDPLFFCTPHPFFSHDVSTTERIKKAPLVSRGAFLNMMLLALFLSVAAAVSAFAAVAQGAVQLHPAEACLKLPNLAVTAAMGTLAAAVAGGAFFAPLAVAVA